MGGHVFDSSGSGLVAAHFDVADRDLSRRVGTENRIAVGGHYAHAQVFASTKATRLPSARNLELVGSMKRSGIEEGTRSATQLHPQSLGPAEDEQPHP